MFWMTKIIEKPFGIVMEKVDMDIAVFLCGAVFIISCKYMIESYVHGMKTHCK